MVGVNAARKVRSEGANSVQYHVGATALYTEDYIPQRTITYVNERVWTDNIGARDYYRDNVNSWAVGAGLRHSTVWITMNNSFDGVAPLDPASSDTTIDATIPYYIPYVGWQFTTLTMHPQTTNASFVHATGLSITTVPRGTSGGP